MIVMVNVLNCTNFDFNPLECEGDFVLGIEQKLESALQFSPVLPVFLECGKKEVENFLAFALELSHRHLSPND